MRHFVPLLLQGVPKSKDKLSSKPKKQIKEKKQKKKAAKEGRKWQATEDDVEEEILYTCACTTNNLVAQASS